MKRMLLRWSAATLAVATFALSPAAQEPSHNRVLPGKENAVKQTKVIQKGDKEQNRALNRLMHKNRSVGEGLGPAGPNVVSVAQQAPAVNYLDTRSASIPRSKGYALVPSHSLAGGYNNAMFGTMDFATGKFERMYRGTEYSLLEDYDMLTTCIVDGIIYIPAYSQNMITTEIRSFWRRIDLATGQVLGEIDFGNDITGFFYALTYNPTTKKFYGLGCNLVTSTNSEYYEIDINGEKPSKTYLGNLETLREPTFAACLAYNPEDGELYTIKANGKMYTVSQDYKAQLSVVKEFSNDFVSGEYRAVPESGYPQCLIYSPRDRSFVTVYRNATDEQMELVFIDVDNDFEVVQGPVCSVLGYYSSLDCDEAYGDEQGPAQAFITAISREKAELSGYVQFTAPTEVYDGQLITNQELTIRTTLDGKEIDAKVVTPGQKYEIPFTTTQGSHTFTITPEFKIGQRVIVGPTSKSIAWMGNDNPVAPQNVVFTDNKITWDAVGSLGQHAGYVDTEAVTYDVYFDNDKQNAEPIKGTEFTFPTPESLGRRVISVVATANNMTSERSDAQDAVFGDALSLPQSFIPSEEQAKLFTTAIGDSNYDFKYIVTDGTPWYALEVVQYSDTPDNWLFLPKMKFESTEHLYQLALKYGNFYQTETTKIKSMIKIYIGKKDDPKEMKTLIYERQPDCVWQPIDLDCLFSVPEPGEYYIGIYTGFAAKSNSRGIRVRDIHVNGLENVSVKSPGAPEDVVLTPAARGELKGLFSFTLPTKAIDGTELPADTEEITVVGTCGDFTNKVSGSPGEKVTLEVEAPIDGFNFFDLTTMYKNERTVRRSYRAYIGVDTPLAPQNITGTPYADNMGMRLTWDPVTIGVNGGWIDPDNIKYDVYIQGSANNNTKVATTRACEYDFKVNVGSQTAYSVGPVAVSEKGNSANSVFAYEFLGPLYDIPMDEEFNQTGPGRFEIGPWKYKADEDFDGAPWQHVTNLSDLGIGNPAANGGTFICSSLGSYYGELRGPKASTTSIHEARIGLRYWNYPEAATMEVWGRRYGKLNQELLFTIEPTRPSLNESAWVDWSEKLPEEYQDCPWIQIYVRARLLQDDNSYCVLDRFRVYQNVDHDFRVSSISGPVNVWTGEKHNYRVVVNNSGLEANRSSFIVRLMAGDKQLMRQDVNMLRVPPRTSYNYNIEVEMKPEYLQYENLQLVATIDDEEDEVALNNEKSMTINIKDNHLPIVKEVSGSWDDDHKVPTLTWTEPALEYGSEENFEYETSFANTDKIGVWRNVDLDKMPPFAIEGARFDGDDAACAWTVFNPSELSLDEERFTPVSGKQILVARSCGFEEGVEAPTQSADWLISPEIVGGTEVSFWMNTFSSAYTETVEIWYSTTDDQIGDEIVKNGNDYVCGSFKRIRPFSKSGSESWEFLTAKLPEDAKYFALVYRSWGQYLAMLDDISFTPKQLSKWEVRGYDVYRWTRSGENEGKYEIVSDTNPLTSFRDEEVGDNNVSYYVHTKVAREDGKKFTAPRSSEVRLNSSGIDDIKNLEGIYGGNSEITIDGLAGKTIAVYTADGKYLRQVGVTSNHESIGIDAGIYIVKCGNKVAKVVVK
ncbi:MAG: choice-of-anchor J domain-containing protein [Prevotella sp.]|nr:choice-of-anchor J domain-containing protein [Bacteroides sp.]MCM1365747.1 choice-of-anchor J domain-containing protein [Prevotella sp.]MCM1436417.1 choice-of-anchor J domain-containing protein [Prevotella sp.]